MRDRREVDRSSPTSGHAPHAPTPRPRPHSVRALLIAAAAGVGITVASSALGRCGDDRAANGVAPADARGALPAR